MASTTAAMMFNGMFGLAAQLLLAGRVGPGPTMDGFIAATTAPMAVVGIGQTALLIAIVPSLARAIAAGNRQLARSLFIRGGAIAWGAAVTGLIATLVIGRSSSRADIVSTSLAWLMCGLGLTAHLRAAVLATHGRFATPVAMNAFYPTLLIIVVVSIASPGTRWLVSAYTVASGMHLAALMLLKAPTGLLLAQYVAASPTTLSLNANERFPWRPLVAGIAATLPSTALPLSDVYWSSRLESGTLSLLALGLRLTVPLCAIGTSGLAYVSFPSIARTAAAGSHEKARVDVLRMGVAAFTMMAPLAAIGIALRTPALSLILTRGQFTSEHARQLGDLLPWFLVSVIGTGISNAVLRSLFVFNMGRRVAVLALTAMVFYAAGSGLLLGSAPTSLAMLYAMTWTAFAGAQVAMLVTHIAPSVRRDALRAACVAAVAAVIAGALCSSLLFAWPTPLSLVVAAFRLVVIGGVGVACYALGVTRMSVKL